MQWSGRHVGGRGLLRQPRFGRVEGLGTGERPQVPSTMWRSHEVRHRGSLRERGRVEATHAQCHHSFASGHDPPWIDLAAAGGAGAGGVLATQFVAQSPPDGYTLLLGSNIQLVQKIMKPDLSINPLIPGNLTR